MCIAKDGSWHSKGSFWGVGDSTVDQATTASRTSKFGTPNGFGKRTLSKEPGTQGLAVRDSTRGLCVTPKLAMQHGALYRA